MSPTADQACSNHCTEGTHCTHSLALIGTVMVEWGIAVQTTSGEGAWYPSLTIGNASGTSWKKFPSICIQTRLVSVLYEICEAKTCKQQSLIRKWIYFLQCKDIKIIFGSTNVFFNCFFRSYSCKACTELAENHVKW